MNENILAFVEIDDVSLAAALLTMGFGTCDTPFIKYVTPNGNTKFRFFFRADGNIQQFIKNWKIDGWESEPEQDNDPFSYIKAYHNNRNGLLDVVKKSAEMAIINNNGKTAVLSKTANKQTQDLVFNKL